MQLMRRLLAVSGLKWIAITSQRRDSVLVELDSVKRASNIYLCATADIELFLLVMKTKDVMQRTYCNIKDFDCRGTVQ